MKEKVDEDTSNTALLPENKQKDSPIIRRKKEQYWLNTSHKGNNYSHERHSGSRKQRPIDLLIIFQYIPNCVNPIYLSTDQAEYLRKLHHQRTLIITE